MPAGDWVQVDTRKPGLVVAASRVDGGATKRRIGALRFQQYVVGIQDQHAVWRTPVNARRWWKPCPRVTRGGRAATNIYVFDRDPAADAAAGYGKMGVTNLLQEVSIIDGTGWTRKGYFENALAANFIWAICCTRMTAAFDILSVCSPMILPTGR